MTRAAFTALIPMDPTERDEVAALIDMRLAQMSVRGPDDVRVHVALSRVRQRIAEAKPAAQPLIPEG